MIVSMRTMGDRLRELVADWRARNQGQRFEGGLVNAFIGLPKNAGYFSRILHDKRTKDPDLAKIDRIAEYFGANFAWLYEGTGEKYARVGVERPSYLTERLRSSVAGRAPYAPGETADNLDAVRYFYKKRYSADFVAEFRAELAAAGIEPNSREPHEWELEMRRRWIQKNAPEFAALGGRANPEPLESGSNDVEAEEDHRKVAEK